MMKLFVILFSTTFLVTSYVWSNPSTDELRSDLQALSRATTENFNAWQTVRKQILDNKNKILEHRYAMQKCLASLRESFDEKLFNSCSVDNYGFAYTIALMPKSSTSLNYPTWDFTGGNLSHSTLELTLQFHKWLAMAKRDVEQFKEAAAPLYETSVYNKLTQQFDAAKERGAKAGFCTNITGLTYSLNSKGEDLKLSVRKAFGDLLGMNLAITNMKAIQTQTNQTLKYCAPTGDEIFTPLKISVDQMVSDAEKELNSTPPSARVERFCLKMAKFNDANVAQICKYKVTTPETLNSIYTIVTEKINSVRGPK